MRSSIWNKDLLKTRTGDAIARIVMVLLLGGFACSSSWVAVRHYPDEFVAAAKGSGIPVWLQITIIITNIVLLLTLAGMAAWGQWERVQSAFAFLAVALVAVPPRFTSPGDSQYYRIVFGVAVGMTIVQTAVIIRPRLFSRFLPVPFGDDRSGTD